MGGALKVPLGALSIFHRINQTIFDSTDAQINLGGGGPAYTGVLFADTVNVGFHSRLLNAHAAGYLNLGKTGSVETQGFLLAGGRGWPGRTLDHHR